MKAPARRPGLSAVLGRFPGTLGTRRDDDSRPQPPTVKGASSVASISARRETRISCELNMIGLRSKRTRQIETGSGRARQPRHRQALRCRPAAAHSPRPSEPLPDPRDPRASSADPNAPATLTAARSLAADARRVQHGADSDAHGRFCQLERTHVELTDRETFIRAPEGDRDHTVLDE